MSVLCSRSCVKPFGGVALLLERTEPRPSQDASIQLGLYGRIVCASSTAIRRIGSAVLSMYSLLRGMCFHVRGVHVIHARYPSIGSAVLSKTHEFRGVRYFQIPRPHVIQSRSNCWRRCHVVVHVRIGSAVLSTYEPLLDTRFPIQGAHVIKSRPGTYICLLKSLLPGPRSLEEQVHSELCVWRSGIAGLPSMGVFELRSHTAIIHVSTSKQSRLTSPAPSDIRGGPSRCTTTEEGCNYPQENGAPFCVFCGPAPNNGSRCACLCRACDPSDSGRSSTDEEGDGEPEFFDARHRCHQRKFGQRERRRMRSKLEGVTFAQGLQEHCESQRDMFYDVREDDVAPAGCRRWMTQKAITARQDPPLHEGRLQGNRRARTAWLVLLVACFCLFGDFGNGNRDDGSYRGVDADVDGDGPKRKKMRAAQHRSDQPIAEVGRGATTRLQSADAATAKWLKWQKTRDEVFGLGVEAWSEGWAVGLIFDGLHCPKQRYLWHYLAHDKHIHRGIGVLRVPGEWKRRLRAKRRSRAVRSGITSGTVQSSQVLRGGGTDEIAIPSPSIDRRNQPSSSAHVENRVPVGTGLYEFSLVDVRNDAIRIKPHQLKIHWVASDDVSESVRQESAEPHHAVETNGNGACAIHSAFGRPSADGKLFAPHARDTACRFLRLLPEAAVTDDMAAQALEIIYTSFWNEFTKPLLSQLATVEGRLFWKALESEAPELAAEARQCFRRGLELDRGADEAKREVVLAARRFFTVANEETCIRPLAVQLGYLGAADQVDIESQGQVRVTCRDDPAERKDGACSARDEDGCVKGTLRVPFPVGGPTCKYSALFDSRPVFDALREAFMLFADPDARASTFLRLLREHSVASAHETFCDGLQQWIATCLPSEAPPQFGLRAWTAYLTCVRESSYYFSVDELLAICMQASVRVLIFKDIEGALAFAGGSLRGQGPLILTKLSAGGQHRVRSHFERLIPASLARQFSNALREEAQERAREEAKLRREREAEAARMRAEKTQREAAERKAAKEAAAKKGGDGVPPPPPASDGQRPAKKRKATPVAQNPRQAEADTRPRGPTEVGEAGNLKKNEDGAGQYNVQCMPCESSKDPRARLELELSILVRRLRDHPTVPMSARDPSQPAPEALSDEAAPLLPPKHCAFKACPWSLSWEAAADAGTEREREEQVLAHIRSAHSESIEPVARLLPGCFDMPDRIAAAYNEAIGGKVREGAPLASYAIDRRCLRKASQAMEGNNIEALICFFCACIYPYRAGARNQHIHWRCPRGGSEKLFFRYDRKLTQRLLSVEAYLQNYGRDDQGFFDLRRHMAEFDDWSLDVPFGADAVTVLCCPEDRQCSQECLEGKVLCQRCQVPVCDLCYSCANDDVPSLPPPSLCNDMMIFYAPEELYQDGGLTIMEMICASPCITSMICFSMEVKYGNLFDSTLHMQRHRVGARGNATTFLLPWESLLSELQRLEDEADRRGRGPDLPRTGKDLAYVVQVLLKTNDEDKRENLKNFVFQAQVNRNKVVNVILGMKRRGHRAFMRVTEGQVREKAKQLPEQGIPPELVSLLPNDNAYEKMRVQKAATPVEGMKSNPEEAGVSIGLERPNAVVLERSALEEGDLKIRRERAVRALVENVTGEGSGSAGSGPDPEHSVKQRRAIGALMEKLAQQSLLQLSAMMLAEKDLGAFACTCTSAGHCLSGVHAPADHTRTLRQRLRDLFHRSEIHSSRFEMTSGTSMQPQFRPWYFGVAFAFLFKFCTGMPDMPEWSAEPRHRRTKDAPRVDLAMWVKLITRRVEQQLKRDWLLGFTMSSVLFRSMLNQCKTVFSYEKIRRTDGSMGFTAAELESGAISICQALDGKYKDLDGKVKKVNGDFTKVKFAVNLNEAGKRLLQNLEHTSRQLKGTMEVRKLMRYETNAGRIRRGVPIFVTFSPDEKHNTLMVRLHRSRANDPIHNLDGPNKRFGARTEPPIDNDYVDMEASCEQMLQWLPSYDERRAILSRDGLASVEGFKITILVVCEYIFGMRVCAKCPDCNHDQPAHCNRDEHAHCQDLFGSNAYSDGGAFGRAEGIYVSIEAQKSAGSLHAHGQLHIECVHQHKPLTEIMQLENLKKLVADYLGYKQHVCREEYEDVEAWEKQRRLGTESAWPEYKESTVLVSNRSYLRSDMDGKTWRDVYLGDHVQGIQEHKQNHVHTINAKGERAPLAHCRRADNPQKCKGDFPRTTWLIDSAVVLCSGLMKRMGMPCGGRRNRMGSIHGPRNEENINGTHPALSALLQTNSDVQLPYRFTITPETHADDQCSEGCGESANTQQVLQAFQCSQDAQIGYTCDYQNKRAARSCNEVKECIKGHRRLQSTIHDKRPDYIGKRQVTRLCSDAYGKGIVRSNQESINLRIGGNEVDVTSAESFHTASFVSFPGRDLTKWREAVYANADYVEMLSAVTVDWRNPHRRTPVMRNVVFLYGHRNPAWEDLWHLSPYEFMVYWTIEPARYPWDGDGNEDLSYHADLQPSGHEKLRRQWESGQPQKLVGGRDYMIKAPDPATSSWAPLPDNGFTRDYRHDWVLVRNTRPRDPTFAACPMPRRGSDQMERNAALILTYFHPFTLNPGKATDEVPFLGGLCKAGMSWHDTMLHWFNGRVGCGETKRYIDNFFAVTRTRPEEEAAGNSDDEFSDDELLIGASNFGEILKTRMGAGLNRQQQDEDGVDTEAAGVAEEVPTGSKQAFDFAHDMWQIPEVGEDYHRPEETSISPENLEKAIAAARASRNHEFSEPRARDEPGEPSVRVASGYSSQDVWKWYDEKRRAMNEQGQPLVKSAQLEMLRIVCQRLCDELQESHDDCARSDPLMWLLHGGPGTGKSEVLLMVKELFRDVCGWEMGFEFQMAALQAVTAQLLEGDTIHHACGINPFGVKSDPKAAHKASQKQVEAAARIMQWRWLFIDEISMVGAKLLAEVDMKLRTVVSDVATMKRTSKGISRAFGGINVVFVGDFWQLDSPGGGFLGSIPVEYLRRGRKFDPKPDIAHGQSILWGSGEGSVQGVTELTECVRTSDAWLLQVQEEMRAGALSEDAWNFLHGLHTTVPGSCVGGELTCGSHRCWKTWRAQKKECSACQRERKSRHRVMNAAGDRRHCEGEFLRAPAIFPNNDIKFEVNKIRAQIYARATKQAISWSIAKDKPGNKVIAEKPNLAEEKKVWLTRHDRDCGSLYGVLPLVKGLPVMLTDHYDRNPKKQLLRGRIGYIKSWILDEREDSEYDGAARYLRFPPQVILVQYFDMVKENGESVEKPCEWVLDGMCEAGVYPIKPWPKSWALDQRRDNPQLWVKRWQLPLAPAYSITAHGSQGQTLRAAIIDLQIGRGVSPIASYVAMTRIRTRYNLLIFRSFDREIFTQGPPEGPSLLLRKLRGEKIDWRVIEDKHAPKARCRGPCMTVRHKEEFSEKEWRSKDDLHCKGCIKRLREQGKTHRCATCRQWFERSEFVSNRRELNRLICTDCKSRAGARMCAWCKKEKPGIAFAATRWNLVLERRVCLECSGGRECSSCSTRGDANKFATDEWEKPDGKRRCKECVPKRCCRCRKAKPRSRYNKLQWLLEEGRAACNDCDRKRCGKCNKAKTHADFDPATWELADGSAAHCCRECTRGARTPGMWICRNRRCRLQKPHSEFGIAIGRHGQKVHGDSRQCDDCLRRRDAEELEQSRRSAEQVQKKARTK